MKDLPKEKKCSKCKERKALERFSGDRRRSDGKCLHCKDCIHRQYLRSRTERIGAAKCWVTSNPEQAKENAREYYHKHAVIIKTRAAAYYAEHRDAGRKARREYAERHPQEAYERGKTWRKNNLKYSSDCKKARLESDPAKRRFQNEANKRWAHANHAVVRRGSLNRQARRRLAGAGHYTEPEWIQILDECGHCCLGCGFHESQTPEKHLERDHIVPLSILAKVPFGPLIRDLASLDLITNIQPLCKTCNRKKGIRIDFGIFRTVKIVDRASMTKPSCPPRPGGAGWPHNHKRTARTDRRGLRERSRNHSRIAIMSPANR